MIIYHYRGISSHFKNEKNNECISYNELHFFLGIQTLNLFEIDPNVFIILNKHISLYQYTKYFHYSFDLSFKDVKN
jgi:hypothetical protein